MLNRFEHLLERFIQDGEMTVDTLNEAYGLLEAIRKERRHAIRPEKAA